MTPPEKVTTAQMLRDYAGVRRSAIRAPVEITHHGKSDMVLVSHEDYAALTAAFRPRPRFAHELEPVMTSRLRSDFPANDEPRSREGDAE